ncbi:MAG: hypothetical protein AB7N65_17720 [Vicinamibacterales bacterium]
MAAKAAVAAVRTDPSDEEIASLGCWSGTQPAPRYMTRKAFTYLGQPVPKGIEIIVPDNRIARRLIRARLLLNPVEVD